MLARRIVPIVLAFASALCAPGPVIAQRVAPTGSQRIAPTGSQRVAPTATQRPAPATPNAVPDAAPAPRDLLDVREQLFALLRISPRLRDVITSDPTLLADSAYIGRVNPELQQFLTEHPEVARNADFYLFAEFPGENGHYVAPLPHHNSREFQAPDQAQRRFEDLLQILVFLVITGSILWLIRMMLQNRRWSRLVRMQAETHTRLMEKFGSSEELLRYMETESGRRFLDAAPIPVDSEQGRRLPVALARILSPLQIGAVLTLLGIGLLSIRHSFTNMAEPLLIFGIVVLMPGIGFILSAAFTWWMTSRLGLMPTAAGPTTGLDRQ